MIFVRLDTDAGIMDQKIVFIKAKYVSGCSNISDKIHCQHSKILRHREDDMGFPELSLFFCAV